MGLINLLQRFHLIDEATADAGDWDEQTNHLYQQTSPPPQRCHYPVGVSTIGHTMLSFLTAPLPDASITF